MAGDRWIRVTKWNADGCALADRHYSRRTPGAKQFMHPGQTVVLMLEGGGAVFGWWRPDPSAGIKSMNGLDGWTCTIFRNETPVLSSALVLAAEVALFEATDDCGPDGLITYVWDKKVKSENPGACFLHAGWKRTGRDAKGQKTLLQKQPEPWLVRAAQARECPMFDGVADAR